MTFRNKRLNPNAFPGTVYDDAPEGMELRDYFAAAVASSMLADAEGCPSPEIGARIAYNWADALLAERARGTK